MWCGVSLWCGVRVVYVVLWSGDMVWSVVHVELCGVEWCGVVWCGVV